MDDPRPMLQAALKEAMKNKNTQRRDVIRMVMSAFKQVEIDQQKELTAEDAVAILQKEAKVRREIIDEKAEAGREELAEGDKFELAVIEEFMPRQLSEDEIRAIVREVMASVGAEGMQDMGKVMGPVMGRVKGLADGKVVNQIVRDELSG